MKIAVAGATGTVGRYVVEQAKKAGHDVAALSRSLGIDIRTGEGLGAALDGVDALIDVTNPPSNDALTATRLLHRDR